MLPSPSFAPLQKDAPLFCRSDAVSMCGCAKLASLSQTTFVSSLS